MKQKYKDNWPFFEKLLGYLRYLKIRKYIPAAQEAVCVDIGCGFSGRFLRSIANRIGGGTALISEQMKQDTERSGS